MSVLGTFMLVLLLLLLAVGLIAVLFLLFRVRTIGRIVGTFECWTRPDTSSGWVAGMARFGAHELQWFRLVGFYIGPQLRMPREGLKVSTPISRQEGVVEVVVSSKDFQQYLAMRAEWYNGLVSWVESGPPKPREEY
ncbi:MAG TPA: DUF2550 family protein [Actinomyces sp.]|jgi:hypothetical protein|nr:DUF2550 family protein [Acidobacteriota bacterium]HHT41494.1 DUF2550 family protein [Actinomyces sp.]